MRLKKKEEERQGERTCYIIWEMVQIDYNVKMISIRKFYTSAPGTFKINLSMGE